jgi:hypothetical protein
VSFLDARAKELAAESLDWIFHRLMPKNPGDNWIARIEESQQMQIAEQMKMSPNARDFL